VTVTYDGRNCAIGGDPVTAGSLAVRVENVTQATLLVTAVTLHPGATWAELQAYVETLEEHEGNPEFVDLVFITPAPGSAQVVDLPAGSVGFACVEQDDEGVPTRVVLSEEHELGG
jgi:hypothetical protein